MLNGTAASAKSLTFTHRSIDMGFYNLSHNVHQIPVHFGTCSEFPVLHTVITLLINGPSLSTSSRVKGEEPRGSAEENLKSISDVAYGQTVRERQDGSQGLGWGTNLTEVHLNWLLRSDQAKSTRTRNHP